MSLYPQHTQPPYPSAGYPPRGPAPYQQQPQQHYPPAPSHPVQPPVYRYADPHAFRRDYDARLGQLTENSRPIIQALSIMAQDYLRWADVVAESIEAHIRQVPPWIKLPAFYLLDSISKNVFEPYGRTFTPFIVPLFLETYGLVDAPTRSKMEEMLLTWRTGSPSGKELFGISSQVAIERGIWGSNEQAQGGGRQRRQAGQVSRGQVLSELDFTMSAKQRALQANPHDATTQHQCMALQQLRGLVEAGVSQEELRQILAQLRTMAPPPPPSAQPQAQLPPPPQLSARLPPPPPPPSSVPSTSVLPPFPPPFPPHAAAPPPAHFAPPVAMAIGPSPPVFPAGGAPAAPVLPDAMALAGLFSALVKAGVVTSDPSSSSGTPTSGARPVVQEELKPPEVDPSRAAAREYRNRLLARPIQLNANDIVRQRPPLADMHYERLRSQCTQCGLRFRDDVAGRKELESHLDMHFKQNRKAAQNTGRGHSRSWFVSIEDWIHDTADVKGKGRDDGARRLTVKEAAAEELVKRNAELRAMHVVIPAGDETKPIKCPICKEPIAPQFLDDVEEWVWQNAVKMDDKVFHATCHAEAMFSANSLVSRIRNDATGSRSATPSSLRATPPSGSPPPAGNKRKAEGEVKNEEGTPPSKKIALSA